MTFPPGTFPPPRPPVTFPPGTFPPPPIRPLSTTPGVPEAPPVQQPSAAYITIQINGGFAFPDARESAYVSTFPGMTIRQALQSTGYVTFGPGGKIVSVTGIRIADNVAVRIRYNGQVIPTPQLNLPAEPNSSVILELYTI